MKKIFKVIIPMFMILTCIFLNQPINVFATDDGLLNEGKATITITHAVPGDKFNVWQIVTITHNSEKNTLKYEFGTDAKPYFDNKGVTIENFMDADSNNMIKTVDDQGSVNGSISLNDLLAGLPAYIEENKDTWGDPNGRTITIGDNGIGVSDPIQASGYFIEPIQTTSVYQVMFASIVPSVDENNNYQFNNITIAAKHVPVGIEKEVKSGLPENTANFSESAFISNKSLDTSSAYNTVTYRIIVDIPHYVSGTNNKIIIGDILSQELTFDPNSIKVYYTDSVENLDLNDSKTIPDDCLTATTNSFELDLSSQYEKFKNNKSIVVYYTATINDTAKVGTDINNTATYTYSAYPYVDKEEIEKTITDDATVKTLGLKVYKYFGNLAESPTPLSNAEFTLYRKALNQEIQAGGDNLKTIVVNNSELKVIEISSNIRTDETGFAKVDGLSPTPDYYLVETSAPSGYKLDSTPHLIQLQKLAQDGYTTVEIENKEAKLTLPSTGDNGMVVLTMLGLAIMSVSVVMLTIVYKKKEVNK